MSNGLQILQSVGAQKIHEKTHIPRQHIQAILHESFDDINKVHFLGFVSICEREYNIELNDLKVKAEEFYTVETTNAKEKSKVFVLPKKKKNYTVTYMVIAIVVFAVAVFITLELSSSAAIKAKAITIDNSAIESAKENIKENIKEDLSKNIIIEDKNDTMIEIAQEKSQEQELVKSFIIKPKARLWLGYIDLATHKKFQKTFSDEISIDPEKNWLLILGHGNVDIEINGKIIEYKVRQNIRFLYKDFNLSKIDITEFKELNRGKKW